MGLKKNSPGCNCCDPVDDCSTCLDGSSNATPVKKWIATVSGWPDEVTGFIQDERPFGISSACGGGTVFWRRQLYSGMTVFNRSIELLPEDNCEERDVHDSETQSIEEWYSTTADCPGGASTECVTGSGFLRDMQITSQTDGSGNVSVIVQASFIDGTTTFLNPTCASQSKTVQTTFEGENPTGCGAEDDISVTMTLEAVT